MNEQQIDITNILEITPELKREILWHLRVAEALSNHLKGHYFSINVSPRGTSKITIYDRHEGELGFYTHDLTDDGRYEFDFVDSGHTPESKAFAEAIAKKYNPLKYRLFYKDK
jgi:hypothetical protein